MAATTKLMGNKPSSSSSSSSASSRRNTESGALRELWYGVALYVACVSLPTLFGVVVRFMLQEEEEETIMARLTTIPNNMASTSTTNTLGEDGHGHGHGDGEEGDSYLAYFARSVSQWVQSNGSFDMYYLGDYMPTCVPDMFHSLYSYSCDWFSWFRTSLEEATSNTHTYTGPTFTTADAGDATVRTEAAMISHLARTMGQQQQLQQLQLQHQQQQQQLLQQQDLGYWWQDLYTCAYIAIGLALFRIYMVHLLVPKSLVLRGGVNVKKRRQPLRAALLRSKSNNFFHLSNHGNSHSHSHNSSSHASITNDDTIPSAETPANDMHTQHSGSNHQEHNIHPTMMSSVQKKSSPSVLVTTPMSRISQVESTPHDEKTMTTTTEAIFTIGDENNFPEDSDTDDYEERLRRISSSMPTTNNNNNKHPGEESSQQDEGRQLKRNNSLVFLLDGLQELGSELSTSVTHSLGHDLSPSTPLTPQRLLTTRELERDHLNDPIIVTDNNEDNGLEMEMKDAVPVDTYDFFQAPRFATALFRCLFGIGSCAAALHWFSRADFWPAYLGGTSPTASTKNCWDLSGSSIMLGPLVDADFDDQNQNLRLFFLIQASYQLHSMAFHLVSMALLLLYNTRNPNKPLLSMKSSAKGYLRPLMEHLVAICLIVGSYLFSSLRRLGAVGMFTLEFSSIFLQLLQMCLNAPDQSFLSRPVVVHGIHRFIVLPTFLYARFFVLPFIVWYSAAFESQGWLKQIENVFVPGLARSLYIAFNGLLVVILLLNLVFFRRLLFHPHILPRTGSGDSSAQTAKLLPSSLLI